MFADSWETAALPRCCHVLEHTEAIVLMSLHSQVCSFRIQNARRRVFIFTPGGPQACWHELLSSTLGPGQLTDLKVVLQCRKETGVYLGSLDSFFVKYIKISDVSDFWRRGCFLLFVLYTKVKNKFLKLKWNLFDEFIFSFKSLRNLVCISLLMKKLWELNVLWAIMWDNKG